jgi:cytochrome P450
MEHLTPLSAVTAHDPYPYYARLVAERPFYFDGEVGMWIASSAQAVEAVLLSDAMLVRPSSEPVPAGIACTSAGEVFGAFMRMTDGAYHAALKRAAAAALDAFAAGDLAQWAQSCADLFPQRTPDAFITTFAPFAMAHALGLDAQAALQAAQDAIAYARNFSVQSADALVATMAQRIDRRSGRGLLLEEFIAAAADAHIDRAALVANAIAFLFQSCDATAGLIGNTLLAFPHPHARSLEEAIGDVARCDSPVQNTRRYASRDVEVLGQLVHAADTILVIVAAANRDPASTRSYTFGAGVHACPAERIAHALAAAAVKAVVALQDPRALRFAGYRPLPNVRIPMFAGG